MMSYYWDTMQTTLTTDDLYFWKNGEHDRLYELFGVQTSKKATGQLLPDLGTSCQAVCVVGDFNNWQWNADPLLPQDGGVWQGNIPALTPGGLYKFAIESQAEKSILRLTLLVECMNRRPTPHRLPLPLATIGATTRGSASAARTITEAVPSPFMKCTWRAGCEWDPMASPSSYTEVAKPLAEYVQSMGFTHVEFLPLLEHPFGGSWGYQVTGYFSPTSRFGTPQELMYLIDVLHQYDIGVILDWVPARFPFDAHGLAQFDGEALYEYGDPRRYHQTGTPPSSITVAPKSGHFDQQRPHVDRPFLSTVSVDAVASMLYLDYSRQDGEWYPNQLAETTIWRPLTFYKP